MSTHIKTLDFNTSPIEIEVKDLKFIKELPKLLGNPHKVTFYQFVWLTKGTAKFLIDFREVTLKASEMVVILPNQICRFDITSQYSGKMIIFTGAFYTVTEIDSNFLYTAEVLNPVSLNQTVTLDINLIDSLISILEDELKNHSDQFQVGITQSLLRVILIETERALILSRPPVTNSIARRFYNLVEARFCENRNTQFYVRLLGVNEKILSKEVKTFTGVTPKMYIDSRIVLESKRLLSYTSLSVKEVGFKLGFDDPGNFNRYFRKHTGVTPSQFRKLQRDSLHADINNE